MKNQLFTVCFISCFLLSTLSYSQSNKNSKDYEGVTELFRSDALLPIKLEYSNLDINNKTNDSTYLKTDFSYKELDGTWKAFELKLRARGNFRSIDRWLCRWAGVMAGVRCGEDAGADSAL